MADLLVTALRAFSFLLIANAVLSWFPAARGGTLASIRQLIERIVQPVLAPIRRYMPPMGGIDLSSLVVILLINVFLIPFASGL